MLRLAFALGVRDEIGTSGALQELLTATQWADGDAPARLTLGAGGGLEPLPSLGTSSLAVWHEGTPLALVRAVDGGEQWDTDVIAHRVASPSRRSPGRESSPNARRFSLGLTSRTLPQSEGVATCAKVEPVVGLIQPSLGKKAAHEAMHRALGSVQGPRQLAEGHAGDHTAPSASSPTATHTC